MLVDRLANDVVPGIRQAAASLLSKLISDATVAAALKTASIDDSSSEVRAAAAAALVTGDTIE